MNLAQQTNGPSCSVSRGSPAGWTSAPPLSRRARSGTTATPLLAAVAHAHCQVAADAVVVRYLKERAPHVGLTWQLVIRRDIFAGVRLREDNSCCVATHNALQLKHSDGNGEVELGQGQQQVDRNITWLCCQKGAGQIRKEEDP